jgi:hypothetical protein
MPKVQKHVSNAIPVIVQASDLNGEFYVFIVEHSEQLKTMQWQFVWRKLLWKREWIWQRELLREPKAIAVQLELAA